MKSTKLKNMKFLINNCLSMLSISIDTLKIKTYIETMQDPLNEEAFRRQIVLWRHPLTTVSYFGKEITILLYGLLRRVWHRKWLLLTGIITFLLLLAIGNINGVHQRFLTSIRKQFVWCIYWLGLGILSSAGLGTGLPTFLLYLGPHIAAVTLAAYECQSVNFPEPPYPDKIICPTSRDISGISFLNIMNKVRLEAVMWGAGTAIGELPPYFMARASRLSGDCENASPILIDSNEHWFDRLKSSAEKFVSSMGFLGILAFASFPNPFYDLVGITCGHFLVPFWKFFAATLLGKAIIKMHLQKMFVIFIFNETQIEKAILFISRIPTIGSAIEEPLKDFLKKEKLKLRQTKEGRQYQKSAFVWFYEKVILFMIIYFIVSIVNSVAQSYHRRLCRERQLKIA